MRPFEKCPVCGGDLVSKEVEKLLRGGKHTAVTIVGLAYDDDPTNRLGAGVTGVPEPATAIPTGFAALALGAIGISRWRAARQTKAA